jgi:hypothetical protein
VKVTSDIGRVCILPKWVFDLLGEDAGSLRLWIHLALIANYETNELVTRRQDIADALGISLDTLDRRVARLRASRVLDVEKNIRDGSKAPTVSTYRVITQPPLFVELSRTDAAKSRIAANRTDAATKSHVVALGSSSGSTASASSLPTPAQVEAQRIFDEQFWPFYPRKVSKRAAFKAFKAALKRAKSPRPILTGLDAALPVFATRPIDKVPYASTWLNADGWEDEHATSDAIDAHLERMQRSTG